MENKTKTPTRRRTIWISDETWSKIETAAKSDDRTVSSWIRRAIDAALDSGHD